MTEIGYMNKRDMAKFEKILTKEHDRISKGIQSLEANNSLKEMNNGRNSSYGIHMADTGSEEEELEKNLQFLSREGNILTQIDDALKRIKKGTFGVCERTGKPIEKARLIAKPFARLCKDAREEVERLGIAHEYE